MGKNRDLAIILIIVIIGMFIPFLGSLLIMFQLHITSVESWMIIGRTFGWFLLIFGCELGIVYLYFTLTNRLAQKKIDSDMEQQRK
jgi:hypothetical protein